MGVKLDHLVVIDKILELTKERKLEWSYLEDNIDLYKGLSLEPYVNIPLILTGSKLFSNIGTFQTSNSFYTKIESGYVVLYKLIDGNTSDLQLVITPPNFKETVVYSGADYTELLSRLLNIIRSTFPSPENVINQILNM